MPCTSTLTISPGWKSVGTVIRRWLRTIVVNSTVNAQTPDCHSGCSPVNSSPLRGVNACLILFVCVCLFWVCVCVVSSYWQRTRRDRTTTLNSWLGNYHSLVLLVQSVAGWAPAAMATSSRILLLSTPGFDEAHHQRTCPSHLSHVALSKPDR
jgi:hypothetical protein